MDKCKIVVLEWRGIIYGLCVVCYAVEMEKVQ